VIDVTLDATARAQARAAAHARRAFNDEIGARDKHGEHGRRDGERNHLIGAFGERALALAMGAPWAPETRGNYAAKDVRTYQVRTVTEAHRRLYLFKEDRDADVFISVLLDGTPRDWEHAILRGWLTGAQGKQAQWWQSLASDPRGRGRWAYFVPNVEMRTMLDLPEFAPAPAPPAPRERPVQQRLFS
jgi:hypothetical protein